MRAITLIAVSALAGLWTWFGAAVAPRDSGLPVYLETRGEELSAATLNNTGADLARRGRANDALAYLERARDFRPGDETIASNVARWDAAVAKRRWEEALERLTTILGILLGGGWTFVGARAARDRLRLRRLRLRGDPWIRIEPADREAELPLRFSEPVGGLVRRHPLTIVWSSARQGKHMRSRPPVRVRGKKCTVQLNEDRIDRLRRHPGDWRGFLYLGKTQVGETAARVG